jgi:hypothetical protein
MKDYNDICDKWDFEIPEIDKSKSETSELGYFYKFLSPLGLTDKDILQLYILKQQSKETFSTFIKNAFESQLNNQHRNKVGA